MRVHYDVDVGGSYGVKRGIKHTVLVAHLARRLGRPVRLIEDRLENMRGGDAHGPERYLRRRGRVRRRRHRQVDEDARARQCRRLCRTRAVPARQADRRHRRPYKIESVQYRAHRGHSPTRRRRKRCAASARRRPIYAIETAIDKVAAALGLIRIEVRRRNFIRKEEFPYLIPSGTTYDSGDYHTVVDKVLAHADYEALEHERDRLRAAGMLAGIGIAACLEPSGGNSSFEPLLNEKNTTTTWMDSCRINVDALGSSP